MKDHTYLLKTNGKKNQKFVYSFLRKDVFLPAGGGAAVVAGGDTVEPKITLKLRNNSFRGLK